MGRLSASRPRLARRRGQCPYARHHARRPVNRFEKERPHLRPLPAVPFDTDEILSVPVTSHARIRYDGNRYTTPVALVRKNVTLRVTATQLRIIDGGQEVAVHQRCYDRGQTVTHNDHRLEALKMRRRRRVGQWEAEFDALGPVARQFHLKLLSMPIKTLRHLGRLLALVRLYGRKEVLAAISRASSMKLTTRLTWRRWSCNNAAAASCRRPFPCDPNAAN